MKLLSLTVPGTDGEPVSIEAPEGIPTGEQFTIGSIASFFIQIALIVGIFLSLAYLVYGGLYWLQASGDKQKWDKARRTIIYAIFGLGIMSSALIVINMIGSAFGIKTFVNP